MSQALKAAKIPTLHFMTVSLMLLANVLQGILYKVLLIAKAKSFRYCSMINFIKITFVNSILASFTPY